MTREHLYRGKRLDNGQWIYGNLLAPAAGEVNAYYIKPGLNGRRVAVEPDSVGQYIGLDDTFGNRVFNGDILKLTKKWGSAIDACSDTWYAIVEFGNPNCPYSWGWQLRRIAGASCFKPDILLWLGEELEETGVTSQVLSEMQALEELREAQE